MSDTTTHDKILDVATNIFAEKGYNGTSMREIAEALDITKAALYYHFPGKEEIFEACISHTMERMMGSFELLIQSEGSIWDKIENLINGMCDFAKDRPQKFRLLKQLAEQNLQTSLNVDKMHNYYKRQRDAVQNLIKKGIKDGELRKDVHPAIIASSIIGMIHHTTGPKMREGAGITKNNKKLTEELMKLIRGGFEQR